MVWKECLKGGCSLEDKFTPYRNYCVDCKYYVTIGEKQKERFKDDQQRHKKL